MFFPEGHLRVWLYTQPTDMRKSYDGLSALVRQHLEADPTDGSLYVFVNRRRQQMKVLFFDRHGYAIWSKRLEQGHFVVACDDPAKQSISLAQLQCLIEGIDLRGARQHRRFRRAA